MELTSDLLLVTPNPAVVAAVSDALKADGHALARPPMRDLRELQFHLSSFQNGHRAAIALVDIDADSHRWLHDLERLSLRSPSTRFIALVSTVDNQLLLEAMQAGVRNVLPKASISTDLKAVLSRFASNGSGSTRAGEAVTILSASGGCGATTLAVNLARELATTSKQTALLVDLDVSYGAIATHLGVEPQYSVDHLLSRPGAIDPTLIRSTTVAHSEHLHVLASPVTTNFSHPEPLAFDRLDQVLEAARHAYSYVVIDAPRVSMDVAATLIGSSARSLLVFQLTVKDVRIAKSMLDALAERGVSLSTIQPLVTRYVKRQHMISLDDAAKALNVGSIGHVQNDYQNAVRGLNYGQALAEAAPRSVLRRDLQELVGSLFPGQQA